MRGAFLAVLILGASPCLAGQPPSGQDPPVSLDRVRAGILKPRALELGPLPLLPVATFRTKVEQVRFVLTFEERLWEELELTDLQRQSTDWGSRCCGMGLGAALAPIGRALKGRRERKIQERIARELEALRAAAGRR